MAETNLDGAANAVFAVTRAEASESTSALSGHTEDGTGKAGTDYQAATGTLTFAPGETVKEVQVLVYGRTPEESTEARTFSLRIDPAPDVILSSTSTTECRIEVKTEDGAVFTSIVVARGPKGTKGDGGLNTYELAKLQGFVGTLADYLASQKGMPGASVELQATDTMIQWRVEGDTEWIDLMPRSQLAGREVELQKGATYLQWRYVGDTDWTNLIAIADLKGDKGDTGAALVNKGAWAAGTYQPGDYVIADGSTVAEAVWILKDTAPYASAVTPKNDATHWVELVPPAGAPGDDGREVQLQKGATAIQWRYAGDTAWTDLVLLADLKGADGAARGWLSGSGAPAAATGADGNMYLDIAAATNGDVYLKAAGTWTKQGNILGPAGSGGGTFATTQEAKDANSTTLVMAPTRTREYNEQFGFGADFTTAPADLDALVKGQFFNYINTTLHRPGTGGYGRGVVLPSGGGYVTQLAVENDTNKMFVRYQSSGTWGDWAPAAAEAALPIASPPVLGGSKVGNGLSIDATTGVLTATGGGGGSDILTAVLGADQGLNSDALTDILSFNVAANTVYSVRVLMPFRTTALTDGIAIGFGGTAGFQTLSVQARAMASDGTMLSKFTKAKGEKLVFPTSMNSSGDNLLVVEGMILGTAAGTFTLQAAQAVTGHWCAAQKGTAAALEPVGTVTP